LVAAVAGPLPEVSPGTGVLDGLDVPTRSAGLDPDEPPPLTERAADALGAAFSEAAGAGASAVSPEHLLLALLAVAPDACAHVLFDAEGVGRRVREHLP
jgi:hypothetical protein